MSKIMEKTRYIGYVGIFSLLLASFGVALRFLKPFN